MKTKILLLTSLMITLFVIQGFSVSAKDLTVSAILNVDSANINSIRLEKLSADGNKRMFINIDSQTYPVNNTTAFRSYQGMIK